MSNIQNYVGMSEAKAVDAAQKDGFRPRITQRDNQHYVCTLDYRTDRINLIIKEGKVASATIG